MKAIVKKRKKESITLKIVADTKTEQHFLNLLVNHEHFELKTEKSMYFMITFVKCDTCKFNRFYETLEGIRNGKTAKIDVGKCKCQEIESYKRIGSHVLENEFCDCKYYSPLIKEKSKKIGAEVRN